MISGKSIISELIDLQRLHRILKTKISQKIDGKLLKKYQNTIKSDQLCTELIIDSEYKIEKSTEQLKFEGGGGGEWSRKFYLIILFLLNLIISTGIQDIIINILIIKNIDFDNNNITDLRKLNSIIMRIIKIKYNLPLVEWRVKPDPGD